MVLRLRLYLCSFGARLHVGWEHLCHRRYGHEETQALVRNLILVDFDPLQALQEPQTGKPYRSAPPAQIQALISAGDVKTLSARDVKNLSTPPARPRRTASHEPGGYAVFFSFWPVRGVLLGRPATPYLSTSLECSECLLWDPNQHLRLFFMCKFAAWAAHARSLNAQTL